MEAFDSEFAFRKARAAITLVAEGGEFLSRIGLNHCVQPHGSEHWIAPSVAAAVGQEQQVDADESGRST